MRRFIFVLLALSTLSGCLHAAELPGHQSTPVTQEAPLRDGEVWVQVGDSITEQKLYTTYLEAFMRARYPRLNFVAVNSGKSGEVYIQGIIRFRKTVAIYKPTLITVNFGMNDHVKVFGGGDFQDEPNNAPDRFLKMAQATGARVAVLSASPLLAPADYGPSVESLQTPPDPKKPRSRSNPVNKLFAEKLRIVTERNNVPFLDLMTPLQIIWEQNYPRDRVAALRRAISPFLGTPIEGENWRGRAALLERAARLILNNSELMKTLPAPDKENLMAKWQATKANKMEAWEAFRVCLREWAKLVDGSTPPFVQVSGYTNSSRADDLIHPNEAGHLHMAGVLFKLMGGDELVSSVSIDATTTKTLEAKKADVRDVTWRNGVLSFKRLDEALPLPIDVLARPALDVDVETALGTPRNLFGLSSYLLQVSNLPRGEYSVSIDGEEVARYSSDELGKGVDLGLMDKGPVFEQSQKLLNAVKSNLVVAAPPKGEAAAAPDIKPYLLEEARPIERVWTIAAIK